MDGKVASSCTFDSQNKCSLGRFVMTALNDDVKNLKLGMVAGLDSDPELVLERTDKKLNNETSYKIHETSLFSSAFGRVVTEENPSFTNPYREANARMGDNANIEFVYSVE